MAVESAKNSNVPLVYGVINNIPSDYHSADLRNFFSQFIESGGFDCFHFRHRPEVKKLKQSQGQCPSVDSDSVDQSVDNACAGCGPGDSRISKPGHASAGETTASSKQVTYSQRREASKIKASLKPKRSTCCIVRLRASKMKELITMYHKKHWLNKQGESIPCLCAISQINIAETQDTLATRYKTREEMKRIPADRETFTEADLQDLLELRPPSIMPNGNVGTSTKVFLELIQACKLPPAVIKNLGLTFPKRRSNRRYGNVPFDYGGDFADQGQDEEIEVFSGRGHEIEAEAMKQATGENSALGESSSSRHKCSNADKARSPETRAQDSESEEDADACEEWERHEALHDDPSNAERNKERLYEEKMEVVWEKGGSGLVFYTDAQYWKEQEGDFDEETADDWDVDMSVYYDAHGGDKDARDLLTMRREKRRRDGIEEENIFHSGGANIGKFEKHSKGIGRKVMERRGWQDGAGLGCKVDGMVDALGNDGQKPGDRSGFGFRGDRLNRYGCQPDKRRGKDGHFIITSVYDNHDETDPPELLLRRSEPYFLKYNPTQVQFIKGADSLPGGS